ncbi:MAG: DUF2062 domain-containing protein [Bacteroidales bacterium]|nr:DUF2062 domain-containing protein [Bacteroidales bacterium]
MDSKDQIKNKFNELNCCVIVPTYNNASVISPVLTKLKSYTNNIIVVNDGSTDNTLSVLANCGVQIVSYAKNRGKGIALQQGFSYAISKGFKYAITIDSDGQHNPDDLILFLNKIEEGSRAIILGARNMEQEGVPAKSSFGNKFSNFWFWFETGYKVPDTQTGYRCYPLKYVANKKYFTNKYEFEIEVMVRGVWSGLSIESVPVSVYYAPKEERISHFRPFKDFTRISILNTFLVFILLLYIKPRNLYRLIRRKSFKDFLKENVLQSTDSNVKMALSVTLGIFMGIAPVWGWQMMIALFFAHVLKLNKAVTLIASNISLPPVIPFLLYFSYVTGGYILGTGKTTLSLSNISFEKVYTDLFQYLVGSLAFGAMLAVVVGAISFLLLKIFRRGF